MCSSSGLASSSLTGRGTASAIDAVHGSQWYLGFMKLVEIFGIKTEVFVVGVLFIGHFGRDFFGKNIFNVPEISDFVESCEAQIFVSKMMK